MLRPNLGNDTAQLAVNPNLMRGYRCLCTAEKVLNEWYQEVLKRRGAPDVENTIFLYEESMEDLPQIINQLAALIVADLNVGFTGCNNP
jgi:hypothetical protein